MRRLFLFLLFLFLLFLVTPTPAEKIEVKFNVDPPNAEVYRLGVAEDVYNGGPEYLGIADQGSVQDKEKFTTSPRMQFLFKAKGYKDLRTTLDVSHVENETGTVLLPSAEVIRLDPLGKSYIPLALVLMGLAIGTGGFLFLRARNQRVEDIGSWVEDHKVTTADEDPFVGKKFGDYWVLERLGRGGMATVYRAVKEEEREGQNFALKIVHSHVTDGADFKQRFQREVAIGDRLIHPNVVTVYDAGEIQGHYFIVLEFLDGGDLRNRLPEQGFSLPDTLDWAIPIFRAVAHSHSLEIVHRDLKPENVLVKQDFHPKLSDFGLARSRKFTTVTVTGSVMGTPGYIAPEQMTTHGPNPASDQYALGVMLFELATGCLPFESDDPMQTLFMHIQEPPPVPSTIKKELPIEFDQLVLKMLAKTPEERFESVEEARKALSRLKDSM